MLTHAYSHSSVKDQGATILNLVVDTFYVPAIRKWKEKIEDIEDCLALYDHEKAIRSTPQRYLEDLLAVAKLSMMQLMDENASIQKAIAPESSRIKHNHPDGNNTNKHIMCQIGVLIDKNKTSSVFVAYQHMMLSVTCHKISRRSVCVSLNSKVFNIKSILTRM